MGEDRRVDPERLDLRAPLPGGALAARVVFKGSHVGRDRTVKRSVATYAEVEFEHIGPRTESRRMTIEEVDAFLAEAAGMQADGARRDAVHRERVAEKRE